MFLVTVFDINFYCALQQQPIGMWFSRAETKAQHQASDKWCIFWSVLYVLMRKKSTECNFNLTYKENENLGQQSVLFENISKLTDKRQTLLIKKKKKENKRKLM